MKDPINLLIAGVGGQGNILVSEILAKAAAAVGYKVTVGESYGMSQRGGSVSSHIRLSRKSIYGPIIPAGCADVIIGFEPVEAARAAMEFGSPGVKIIVNPRPVYPVGVLMGKDNYPDIDKLLGKLKDISAQVYIIESTEIASRAGNPVMQNIVMVGALAGFNHLFIPRETFVRIISQVVPEKVLDLNKTAFSMGYNAAQELINPE
ncbi:indolepyruvate oxidoreductase subunit beta [Pelotomaculum propionicicum]|uniref:indolepyruvate oxidoreductase subunit beta n=1 Tax=Pelotomaculum propionicicum TaxID=258475 RepID=UPI003B780B91